MPIEIICDECQVTLRVPDSAAGRKAKCPKCNLILPIPGQAPSASASTSQPVKAPSNFENQTPQNPFARKPQEQTTDYSAKPNNPYASPLMPQQPLPEATGVIDLNTVFSYGWQIFTNNLGLLLGVALTLGVVNLIDKALDALIENTNDITVILICFVASLALALFTILLGIGQARIALKLCRGEMTSYEELFGGSDRFLKTLGWSFLIIIPLILSLLLLVIPFFFLIAIYWPTYYLIVDRKTGVFDSFPVAQKMGLANLGSSFLLMLASVGIMLLGLLACGIGVLFAGCYVTVLWATAYLMMTGEIRTGAVPR